MLQVLVDRFCNADSVLSISARYNFSFQLIYSFISQLIAFLPEIINTLKSLYLLASVSNPSVSDVLVAVLDFSRSSNFQRVFFVYNRWMVFMRKFHFISSKSVWLGS